MTRVLEVGNRGLDFAYKPASYAKMALDGSIFWCRYSKGVGISPSSLGIRCQPGEIADSMKAGGDFFANFELGELTPEEGAASGKANALKDKDFWPKMGLAPKAGVIISWEPSGPVAANDPRETRVAQFCDAYRNNIGRIIGAYMPLPTMLRFRKSGLIDFTWLPMSSNTSGINTSAAKDQSEYAAIMEKVAVDNGINMVQNRNRWYVVNGVAGADENKITTMWSKPFSHLQALSGGVPVSVNGPEKWDKADEAKVRSLIASEIEARQVRFLQWLSTGAGNAMMTGSRKVPAAAGLQAGDWSWLNGTPKPITLTALNASIAKLVAQESAQTAALNALATQQGLTPEQLTEIINTAVEEGLKNNIVDVDVSVHGVDPTSGGTA